MNKPKITYFYDALCGWCYGFSPVISKLKDQYENTIDFEVISGGLFTGQRIGLINDIASYIKQGAYRQVEERTGVLFGEAFLEELNGEGNLTLNSIYPAVAMAIFKEYYPNKVIEFSAQLKKAVYHDGMNPIDIYSYENYLLEVLCEIPDFTKKMEEQKYLEKALEEFHFFQKQSSSGFPSLLIEIEDRKIMLARGYTDFSVLEERLESLL